MNEVKGLMFDIAYQESAIYQQENLNIRFINFNHLLDAKNAVGRFKDKNDIEQLTKRKKSRDTISSLHQQNYSSLHH